MTNQDTLPTPSPLVAYFCMEFALDNEYGIYSGGLGVLAGDLLNQANDNNANLVGVGLAYASTYNQTIADDGRQLENNITIDPVANGLTKIMDKDDEPIEVVVPINNRLVRVRAWSKK